MGKIGGRACFDLGYLVWKKKKKMQRKAAQSEPGKSLSAFLMLS